MKGDAVPDSDNIARFCKPSTALNGIIEATAFMLRERDKGGLSVNWLEFLKCSDRDHEVKEVQRIYSETLSVSKKARIAILNVGEIRDIVRSETHDDRNIEVLHDPVSGGDQSHSEIHNLKPDNEEIAELILEVLRETHPAR